MSPLLKTYVDSKQKRLGEMAQCPRYKPEDLAQIPGPKQILALAAYVCDQSWRGGEGQRLANPRNPLASQSC